MRGALEPTCVVIMWNLAVEDLQGPMGQYTRRDEMLVVICLYVSCMCEETWSTDYCAMIEILLMGLF